MGFQTNFGFFGFFGVEPPPVNTAGRSKGQGVLILQEGLWDRRC